jgi:hemerythrin superfamily protein
MVVSRIMDAIELLLTQHAEAEALFDKLDRESDEADWRAMLGRLVDRLTMHAKLEEEIFYPAVAELREGRVLTDDARAEHASITRQLEKLRDPHARKADLAQSLAELRRTVQHHVAEEETEMMPQARRLGAGTLRDLGRKMEAHIQVGDVEYQKVAGERA